jgi:hypothetical protein
LASTPAQAQSYLYHYPPRYSQEQIIQHNKDGRGRALDESAPHSLLPQALSENSRKESNENVSQLERDIQLAFRVQEESSSSAPAPAPHALAVSLLSCHTLKAGLVVPDRSGFIVTLHFAIRTGRRHKASSSNMRY